MPDIIDESRMTSYQRLLAWENSMSRRLGMTRLIRYMRNWEYFAGENLPPDNVEQPLSINYVAPIHEKHTMSLFGQWKKDIVRCRVTPAAQRRGRPVDPDERQLCDNIEDWVMDLFRQNQVNGTFYNCALNSSIYGDGVLKVYWDVYERVIKIESVNPEYVHFKWHPNNMHLLTEVIVAYHVDRQDAWEQWGKLGNTNWSAGNLAPAGVAGMAIQWERWTSDVMEVWIDDQLALTKPNPYKVETLDAEGNTIVIPGIIPFIHIPNLQAGSEFFGFGDAEGVLYLQDELNRVMADMADLINNHAHPITLVKNFHGSIDELTVGPDQAWNMGREGDAEYLQHSGPAPAVLEFVALLQHVLQDTSMLPDAAFGRSHQSQASGVALSLALMPVTDRATRKRLIWDTALRQAIKKCLYIQNIFDPQSLPDTYANIVKRDIAPLFAPILPKDRLADVNETVALMSNYVWDLQTALENLGEEDPSLVVQRVNSQLTKWSALGVIGKGNQASQSGGSNALPGSGQKSGGSAKEAA